MDFILNLAVKNVTVRLSQQLMVPNNVIKKVANVNVKKIQMVYVVIAAKMDTIHIQVTFQEIKVLINK